MPSTTRRTIRAESGLAIAVAIGGVAYACTTDRLPAVTAPTVPTPVAVASANEPVGVTDSLSAPLKNSVALNERSREDFMREFRVARLRMK